MLSKMFIDDVPAILVLTRLTNTFHIAFAAVDRVRGKDHESLVHQFVPIRLVRPVDRDAL